MALDWKWQHPGCSLGSVLSLMCDADRVTLVLGTPISHHKDIKTCVAHHVRSTLPATPWLCCLSHLICVVYHAGSVLPTMLYIQCLACWICACCWSHWTCASPHVGSVLPTVLGLCYLPYSMCTGECRRPGLCSSPGIHCFAQFPLHLQALASPVHL